jgi:heptaprenyl diphosphate synthase
MTTPLGTEAAHASLSPDELRIANNLLAWVNSYLMSDNPEIKRPAGSQAVCPYIGASLKRSSLYVTFHPEIRGDSVDDVETIMIAYLNTFPTMPPCDPTQALAKALLVVFPKLPEEEARILDSVYQRIKTQFVGKGLMVAQFHRNCSVGGVHNPAVKVNNSPWPLMAIRKMDIHDIIFLDGQKDWFQEYERRFGSILTLKSEDSLKLPLRRYLYAKQRFGE